MVDTFDVQPLRGAAMKTTNFAKTLGSIFTNGVYTGLLNDFDIIDQVSPALDIKVDTGQCIIDGIFVELSVLSDAKSLTDDATNSVFLTIQKNVSDRITGAAIEIRTSGNPTDEFIKIGEVVTASGDITSITQTGFRIQPINNFTAWKLGTEESSTPITDDLDANVVNVRWYARVFALPTIFPFYRITFIETKTGSTGSGSFIAGVSLVDGQPPVSGIAHVAAYTTVGTHVTSSTIKQAIDKQLIVLAGGARIAPWINASAIQSHRIDIQGNVNRNQTLTYSTTIEPFHDLSWTSTTQEFYLKVYFKGYGKLIP